MATSNPNEPSHHKAVIGNESNFWLYSSKTGFDLTHPATPSDSPVSTSLTIETTTTPITIDPAKSALIIIDMQNYFLSPALGRAKGAGHAATDQLVKYAVPAARKAGIRVVWVNWGLTEKEVEEMPPAVKRAFGFEATIDKSSGKEKFDGIDVAFGVDKHGKKSERVHHGLGSDMGVVKDPESGKEIQAGRVLMRDAWNSALFPPLDRMYEDGKKLESMPDVWVHKNRMSGMWGVGTDLEVFLEKEGIRTLFFVSVVFLHVRISSRLGWWAAEFAISSDCREVLAASLRNSEELACSERLLTCRSPPSVCLHFLSTSNVIKSRKMFSPLW